MAARKEIEKAVKFKEYNRAVDKLLTTEDKEYLFYSMKEYNTYKSVGKLMLALYSCLDSPDKLDLLPYIRDIIPIHHKRRFDHLAPYNRMAHPIRMDTLGNSCLMTDDGDLTSQSVRVINLKRTPGTPLGFNIRGGQEHDLGIYVSHVESFSLAEKAGLQVGDKVVRVNKIDFERVSHSSAVLVLQSHDNLKIEVKNVGNIPGQTLKRESFVWVGPDGKQVEEENTHKIMHSISRDERSPDCLLSCTNKCKIVLHKNKTRSLGFSIRGGREYGLGIYISMINPSSCSEKAGLHVGDQILDINGHKFLSILHFEAVHILRSYKTLIMTITSLGCIPTLQKNEENEDNKNAIGMEQSPITRRKASEFLKCISLPIRTSKRPANATIVEENEQEENKVELNKRDTASLKRSESERQKMTSLPHSSADLAEVDAPLKQHSNSFCSSPCSQRENRKKRAMAISPLATHETRAGKLSSSPITSPGSTSPIKVRPKFFEKGIGTQVMLASLTSHAEQMLFDKARRALSKEDVDILKEDLEQYDDSGDVRQFVDCLISIFNTSEKMELLRDIRSVIKPLDIVKFDEIVSPHELKALRKRLSESDESDDVSIQYQCEDDHDMDECNIDKYENYIKLIGIQHYNGVTRNYSEESGNSDSIEIDAHLHLPLINKNTPRISAPEAKATDFSLYGNHYSEELESLPGSSNENRNGRRGERHVKELSYPAQHSPLLNSQLPPEGNPVIVEVNKDAPYIGLAIQVSPDSKVLVKEVRPGGAIDRNKVIKETWHLKSRLCCIIPQSLAILFKATIVGAAYSIEPGYEIFQVDNLQIRGKSYHEAAQAIANIFKTDGPTVQFIVIPD